MADTTPLHRWRPRDPDALRRDREAAVEAFQARARTAEQAALLAEHTREQRLDARRRLDALQRQQRALVERAAETARLSAEVVDPRPRVVVAHRQPWLRDRLSAGLLGAGLQVVGQVENGADALGLTVAEQPDLLFVEDALPMVGGLQVLAESRELAPATLVAVQVAYASDVGRAVEVGAAAAFPRTARPADIAEALRRLLVPA